MRRQTLTLLFAFLLSACAGDQPAITPLTLDYAPLGAIRLDVAKINFINHTPLTPEPGAADFSAFKPSLADAGYRWGVDRLQAVGAAGQADMRISNASITRNKLPVPQEQGVKDWFSRPQTEQWVARMTVQLRVHEAPGNFVGLATASVGRSTTVLQNPTPAEQEAAYRRLLLGLMDDLNVKMTDSIREHLSPVLLSAP